MGAPLSTSTPLHHVPIGCTCWYLGVQRHAGTLHTRGDIQRSLGSQMVREFDCLSHHAVRAAVVFGEQVFPDFGR